MTVSSIETPYIEMALEATTAAPHCGSRTDAYQ
jgi:hypothetical protein